MGAASSRPVSRGTGQPGSVSDSSYYNTLINNQKQQVANVPAVQSAQNRAQTPPNRPGPTPPGFGNQQQGQVGPDGGRYQGAYDAYVQRYGGGNSAPQQPPPPPPTQPSGAPQGTSTAPPPRPNRPGIRMGNGYASRS